MDIRIEEIYTFHLIHHDRMRDGYDLMQPDLRLYQSVLKKNSILHVAVSCFCHNIITLCTWVFILTQPFFFLGYEVLELPSCH